MKVFTEKFIAFNLLLLFSATFIVYSIKGVDFGTHADEMKLINSVANTIKTGTVLPGWYNYPSLSYLIILFTAFIDFFVKIFIFKDVILPHLDWVGLSQVSDEFANYILTDDFKLHIRILYIFITSFTSYFVMKSIRLLGGNWIAAALGGACILASFQIFYHSRWIAPDTLTMFTGSLTLFSCLKAYEFRNTKNIVIATVCAGLAVSAKYPAGVFILFPLYLATQTPEKKKHIYLVLISFITTIIIVTPGIILQPITFVRDVYGEMWHYKFTGMFNWTLKPGLTHLLRILDFITFRLFSQNNILSVILLVIAIGGLWFQSQKKKLFFIVFIPVFYIYYFSSQTLMIVRNLLVLSPFIAVWIGLGLDGIMNVISRYRITYLLPLLLGIGLLYNQQHFIKTTETLNDTDVNIWQEQITKFISDHANYRIGASEQVIQLLNANGDFDVNSLSSLEDADIYLFNLEESFQLMVPEIPQKGRSFPVTSKFCANFRDAYSVIAGPNEIDSDYYPFWTGKNRILAIKFDKCLN